MLKHKIINVLHYKPYEFKRNYLSKEYICGTGIEIGALNSPLKVYNKAKVKYVDWLKEKELREQFPELDKIKIKEPDIIDDGETLSRIQDDSQDFVIANHFFEHCENPIKTFENFLRVLKSDGIIFLAVPDKRLTFDKNREITPLEHLIRDYEEGPEWYVKEHYKDWVINVLDKHGQSIDESVEELMRQNYRIHFHVWTYIDLLKLFIYLKEKRNFNFEIEEFAMNPSKVECIFIFRKGKEA